MQLIDGTAVILPPGASASHAEFYVNLNYFERISSQKKAVDDPSYSLDVVLARCGRHIDNAPFRAQMKRIHESRPGKYYYSLKNTGRDVVLSAQSVYSSMKREYSRKLSMERKQEELALAISERGLSVLEEESPKNELTLSSIYMQKSRLLDRLKSFTAFSKYCYFFTITAKDGDSAVDKKRFLYDLENLRKKHQKLFGKMHYVGVLERHPRRKKNPWHAHLCVFFESGYKDYKELWETFGVFGRIDLDKVKTEELRSLSNYAHKSLLETLASYFSKDKSVSSHLLVSKGSPKPVRTYHTVEEARAMLNNGSFESRKYSLPGGGEREYFYSDTFSEVAEIIQELQRLDALEDELLEKEVREQPATQHHRR